MDSVSLVMFASIFLAGFVMMIFAILELKNTLLKNELPVMGLFASLVAMIVFFVFGIYWAAFATEAAFVGLAYLWYGLGFSFTAVFLVMAVQLIRLTIMKPKESAVIFTPQFGQKRDREEQY